MVLRMHPPTQQTLFSYEDLERELSTARTEMDRALTAVREFSTLADLQPWSDLEHRLDDLRAAAITVATLEQMVDRVR